MPESRTFSCFSRFRGEDIKPQPFLHPHGVLSQVRPAPPVNKPWVDLGLGRGCLITAWKWGLPGEAPAAPSSSGVRQGTTGECTTGLGVLEIRGSNGCSALAFNASASRAACAAASCMAFASRSFTLATFKRCSCANLPSGVGSTLTEPPDELALLGAAAAGISSSSASTSGGSEAKRGARGGDSARDEGSAGAGGSSSSSSRAMMGDGGGGAAQQAVLQEPEPPSLEEYLYGLFEEHDADWSGSLEGQELYGLLMGLGLGITEDEMQRLRHEADADGSGSFGTDGGDGAGTDGRRRRVRRL